MSSVESVESLFLAIFLGIIFALPAALCVAVAGIFYGEITNRFLHDQSDESNILVTKNIDIRNTANLLNLIEKQRIINEMQQAYWADLKKNLWKFKIDR